MVKNNIIYILMGLMFISCTDSLLQTKLKNNTGKSISIEQYSAPNYFYKDLNINTDEVVDVHSNFIVIQNNKIYMYNIQKAIGKNNYNLIKKGMISLQLNENMFMYVVPQEYNKKLSLNQLLKIQPDNFPIVPEIKSCKIPQGCFK